MEREVVSFVRVPAAGGPPDSLFLLGYSHQLQLPSHELLPFLLLDHARRNFHLRPTSHYFFTRPFLPLSRASSS